MDNGEEGDDKIENLFFCQIDQNHFLVLFFSPELIVWGWTRLVSCPADPAPGFSGQLNISKLSRALYFSQQSIKRRDLTRSRYFGDTFYILVTFVIIVMANILYVHLRWGYLKY